MEILRLEAEALGVRLGLQLGFGIPPKVKFTLDDFLLWYQFVMEKEQIADITLRYRVNALRRLIDFLGGDFLVAQIDRHRIDEFKRELLKTSKNGAYYLLQKLQAVFRKAFYENSIEAYPFAGFKFPQRTKNQALILTPDQMFEISSLMHSRQTKLAWDIARFTGIRGNDLIKLTGENFDFAALAITFNSAKVRRFESVVIHPNLISYLEHLREFKGSVFGYTNEQSLSLLFRQKIRQYLGSKLSGQRLGTHTPRRSLGYYLRHVARWRKEDIRIFLGHHDDVTDLYLSESIETIRDAVNALPFR
jgi:integrase